MAKVSCILRHRGLILTYSWARPAIPVAGKGRVCVFVCVCVCGWGGISSLSIL